MSLMLYGAVALQIVTHECGHAVVGTLAGCTVSGMVLDLFPFLAGHVTNETPLIEVASSARRWCTAGGPLFSVAAGLIFVGLASMRRYRTSVFLVSMAVVLLGNMSLNSVLGGLFATGLEPRDLTVLGSYMGLSTSSIAVWEIVVGLPATIAVGWWFCRRTIAFGYLESGTSRQRFGILFWGAWLPLLLVALPFFVGTLADPGRAGWQALVRLPLLVGLAASFLSGLPALWLIAKWTRPVETAARPLRPLFASSVVCAAVGVTVVLGVGAYFEPPYAPSLARVERSVASSPDDPRVLRTAAFQILKRSNGKVLPESERHRLAARGRELRLEALRLDPENPGALYDVASLHNSDGDEAAERGDWVTARARWSEAFELARRASEIRDDIPAIPARLAQLGEKLEEFERAADYWDRYAAVVAEEEIFPASRRTHVEMAEGRSRALRAKAEASKGAGGEADESAR